MLKTLCTPVSVDVEISKGGFLSDFLKRSNKIKISKFLLKPTYNLHSWYGDFDHPDITEISLKVALNTINQPYSDFAGRICEHWII